MALITCPDCNHEMSDAAPSCPKCGRPNASAPAHVAFNGQPPAPRKMSVLLIIGVVVFPLLFAWFTLRKGHTTKAKAFSFGWLIFCLVVAFAGESGQTPSAALPSAEPSVQQDEPAAQQATVAELPVVTADAIAKAYDENTVAADQRFKGKQFKVSGVIDAINTDFMGDPYITLKGGVNQFMEPQFKFDKAALDQLATLKKGMTVTLVCTGAGDIAKTPMNEECSLQ